MVARRVALCPSVLLRGRRGPCAALSPWGLLGEHPIPRCAVLGGSCPVLGMGRFEGAGEAAEAGEAGGGRRGLGGHGGGGRPGGAGRLGIPGGLGEAGGAGEAAEAGRNWGVCGEAGGGRESTEAGGAGLRSPLARGVWGVRSQGVTRDQRHCMCRKKSFTNLIVIISAFGTYFPVLQNLKNRI